VLFALLLFAPWVGLVWLFGDVWIFLWPPIFGVIVGILDHHLNGPEPPDHGSHGTP
jgi:hypothetical protein